MREFNEVIAAEIAKILNKHDVKIPFACLIDIVDYVDDVALQRQESGN